MVFNFRKRKLNVVIQAGKLRKYFPDSFCRTKKELLLVWKGKLQPTTVSQIYTVCLRYKLGDKPEVRVIEPKLSKLPEHVYPGERLCLYYPGEWQPDMNIAETIIPWASEWLLHYEIWLATGEWKGGGIHPNIGEKKNKHKTRYPIKEIPANGKNANTTKIKSITTI